MSALRARLAAEPYFENGVTRCDCFLLDLLAPQQTEPPALIQLVSGRTRHSALPPWKVGDTITLEATIGCGWNDVGETGRCYVNLAIQLTCEGREGFLTGMVPFNPNWHDFSRDEHEFNSDPH